jgi:NADPH:quinone reductase-like Zn-dependent oxidoreductase
MIRLMFGLRAPRNPVRGFDVAGTVESVGTDEARLRPGDEVFGSVGLRSRQGRSPSTWPPAPTESGAVTPVLDRTHPLSGAREAVRTVQDGHARGKTVLTVG